MDKHKRLIVVLFVIAVLALLFGCATPSRVVTRTSPDTQTDLSGRWNDTDARIVAEEMIHDVLSRPWLQRFERNALRRPVVIVGDVRNMSSEHIDTSPFIRSMERELINNGTVRFVAGDAVREKIRQERLEQQVHADEATAARLGAETGADFMLQGSIVSMTDAVDGTRAVTYIINLDLIDIETTEIVWIGNTEIKKIIELQRYSW